jgi:hypothetical protein
VRVVGGQGWTPAAFGFRTSSWFRWKVAWPSSRSAPNAPLGGLEAVEMDGTPWSRSARATLASRHRTVADATLRPT